MINGLTVLAVIPARGGSKRTPRKNIRDFRGKPLLAWSIDAAEKSKYIDMSFVSTEDAEIAAVADLHGGTTMFRPPELATDDASNEDVLRHVLHIHPADIVVLLQPTSPLRTTEDIDRAIELATPEHPCISYRLTGGKHGGKNGAVYVAYREWLMLRDFGNAKCIPYMMPESRSLDIDLPEEFDA